MLLMEHHVLVVVPFCMHCSPLGLVGGRSDLGGLEHARTVSGLSERASFSSLNSRVGEH